MRYNLLVLLFSLALSSGLGAATDYFLSIFGSNLTQSQDKPRYQVVLVLAEKAAGLRMLARCIPSESPVVRLYLVYSMVQGALQLIADHIEFLPAGTNAYNFLGSTLPFRKPCVSEHH